MRKSRRFLRFAGILAWLLMALCGCAGLAWQPSITQNNASTASQVVIQRVPRVQDCAVIQTGTPSRFACNGKVYTSFQLAKLREDEAKKYAAGK